MEIKLKEFLSNQEWFQQLQDKWAELDPQSQLYLKLAGAISSFLLVLTLMVSFAWKAHKTQVELTEKSDLLRMITNANKELRQLKESTATASLSPPGGGTEPWSSYLSNLAGTIGIAKESLSLSDEQKGTTTDFAQEFLIDLKLKHVNVRQLVKYTFSIENGTRPVKLRNLQIESQEDASGYLDATLSVSTFSLLPTNK